MIIAIIGKLIGKFVKQIGGVTDDRTKKD
ncbi:protein of unknown function [[Clostridium] ultunense Esp]|uniref:Uncharacterized protein n=1 Tax=[Clostridium] ultunense Esp TaxID=1288971 RepID=A0A1M4PM08_9FIRM|nr:protein of unknown function [[Clostridium] ultunense Esp]